MKAIGTLFVLIGLFVLPVSALTDEEEEEIRQICAFEPDPERCFQIKTKKMGVYIIEGFEVFTSPTLLAEPGFTHQKLGMALDAVQAYLFVLDKFLPTEAMNALRGSSLSIYIEHPSRQSRWDPCMDAFTGACYNPNLNQIGIRTHGATNSILPDTKSDKAEGINTLLHEMAHAYHFQVILGRFNNPCIIDAYKRNKHLYYDTEYFSEGVNIGHPLFLPTDTTYLTTNEMEYFARLTELYFLDLYHYPYHRAEFYRYDPDSYLVIQEAWKDPAFCHNGPQVQTPVPLNLGPIE